ncbi:MAG: DUF6364 family protein [Bacteroidota bacterium]|nr:DUF6364 family protein [Bacteroidota bacterium]
MKSKSNKTKLTLSCDVKIIKEAKAYVMMEEESISSIVEDFLAAYVKIKKNKETGKFSFEQPEIRKLSGVFKLGSHRDYKKE